MASKTKITKCRRNLRDRRSGKARKRIVRAQGTTPPFSIHTPANPPLQGDDLAKPPAN